MIDLGFTTLPDYPYDYRIELTDYETEERDQLTVWLKDHAIPHTTAGWNTGSVIYMRAQDAIMFALRWA
jgi:hypothetical protein